ncbi:MAG: PHB depolymerase family esterase, partial [Chloroflexota bacterium]
MKKVLLIVCGLTTGIYLIGCSTLTEESKAPATEAEIAEELAEEVQTGTYTATIEHNDLERSYLLHVPAQANLGEPLPLLLNLHGMTGTSESQLSYADFRPIADRDGVLLVYPQGTTLNGDTIWNVGSWTRASDADDIGFLVALIDELTAEFNVDSERVYSIGHSNGGYMSFLLACQAGDKITAVASVSGTMTPETYSGCEPSHPTPVLQIHGTADSVVPYNGSSWTRSVDQVIDYWTEFNGLSSDPVMVDVERSADSTADSTVTRMLYSDPDTPAVVEHIMVDGGDHEWLGQGNAVGEANL